MLEQLQPRPRGCHSIGNAAIAYILCLAAVLLAGRAARAAGQAAPEGRVSGHVSGPGDIAVPGATVVLINSETGERKATWTDEAGNYSLTGIKSGTYKLEVSLVGLRTQVREPVTVGGGSSLRMDAALVLALPESAPEVRSGHPAASGGLPSRRSSSPETRDRLANLGAQAGGMAGMTGAMGDEMGGNGAANLRFSEDATGASGGAQPGDNSGAESEPSQADAGASAANSFLLQGNSVEASTPGGPEGRGGRGQGFRNGQGPGGAPGFGGGGGGGGGFGGGGGGGFGGGGFGGGGGFFGGGRRPQVYRLRGSLFEDFSNSAFNARPYPLNPEVAGSPQVFYYSEKAGITIGGPLAIPKIYNGKDKTSFFVNYQLQRARSPFSNFATVPTLAERQGNFSDALVNGVVPTIYNPMSNPLNPDARTPFAPSPCGSSVPCPGNVIPSNLINKSAAALMAYIPAPNLAASVQNAQGCAGGVGVATCVPYNFYLNESLPSDNDHLMVRIGHQISSKDNVNAFYNLVSSQSSSASNFPELTASASTRQQSLNLGETHNFGPRFFNNFTLNFSRTRTLTLNPFAYQENIASELGIQGVSQNPFDWGLPIISFTNYNSLNDTIPSLNRNQTLRAVDFVIWNRGKHNLRFGGEVRRIEQNSLTDPDARGTFNFTGYTTSGFSNGQPEKNTGLDFADFLLGLPQITSERFGTASNYLRSWVYAGFVQDDWRATSRLTFLGGVRYEYFLPYAEKYGHLSDFLLGPDFSSVSVVTGQSTDGLPASLIHSDPHLFSPRLGMAFRPWIQHSFVVRAGYGVFYNGSIYSQLVKNLVDQPPFAKASTLITSPAQELTPGCTVQLTLCLENGFPTTATKTSNNTYAVDPNYRVPYGQTWNFTLEGQILRNVVLSVGYVGTKGTKLDLLLAPNQALTGQAALRGLQFRYETDGAASIYNALQVNLRRQFHNGFSLSGNYSYSKSIDNAASVGGAGNSVAQDLYNLQAERGLSTFDMRHKLLVNWNYEFPFGERRRWLSRGGALAKVLGNWQISGYGQIQSGLPYTASLQGNQSDNAGGGAFFSQRPDATGEPVSLSGSERTTLKYFNTAAFTPPPSGVFGNAGRNTIPGPGMISFNTSLDRFVDLNREKGVRLDFRISANNLFNTPNYGSLGTVFGSLNFGSVTSVKSMRAMDFSVRLRF